jgi:dipeptidyl aminopeptidase/acylaminoacyl peptidase
VGTRTIRHWAAWPALSLAGALAACDNGAELLSAPEASAPPMIARADLFADAARSAGQISPRGDRVAFLAPRDGVANIWVLSVDAMEETRPVTDDAGRGVGAPVWALDNTTLLYLKDETGDENSRLFAVDAAGGASRALTPAGARAEIVGLSGADPGDVMVALNQRDRAWPDLYRIDIASGARELVYRNTNSPAAPGISRFVLDRDNRLRLGVRQLPSGESQVLARSGDSWRLLLTAPFQDAMSSRPLAVEADGRSFLMLDSTGRDRAVLVRVNLESGKKEVLGESATADVVDVWLDPAANQPAAYAAEYLRREWRALDASAQADLDYLDRQLDGDFEVVSRSASNARWIVVEQGPTLPPRSYLYDRGEGRRLTLLFRHWPDLEQAPLQPMTPVEIEARDGLTLVSYLTLPAGADTNGDGRPEAPTPLVLAPHDGPWTRDSYGYNPFHQWLANRGYAVLSVNFRGSTGFGPAFLNAGNSAWGGRIQEDLLDAARWAVQNGIAQPERLAIVGAGFGGYAALSGAAFTPGQFRCAASFGAMTNLATYVEASPRRDELYLRVGDARTSEGRALLRAQSPGPGAASINQPLLLAFGANDARVSRDETDQIAASLSARGVNVTYVVFQGEGRVLARPANRFAYYAVLEHFLGDCLGGRVEPVGTAFEQALLQAVEGAVNVPGLSAFVRRRPSRPPTPPPVVQQGRSAPPPSPARPPPESVGPPS